MRRSELHSDEFVASVNIADGNAVSELKALSSINVLSAKNGSLSLLESRR